MRGGVFRTVKEKLTKKIIIQTVIRLVVMSAICIASLVCMQRWFSYMHRDKGPETVLNFGWDLRFNENCYSGVDLRSFSFGETGRGDEVELTCTIPASVQENSLLMVHVH